MGELTYPYVALENTTKVVNEIVLRRPKNIDELKGIPGLGDMKINEFGEDILEMEMKKQLLNMDLTLIINILQHILDIRLLLEILKI